MKAYKISCECDCHEIKFAKRAKDLRGCRSSGFCGCDYIDLRVTRAPNFDQYAPGPVTVAQYFEQGWQWECVDCGERVLSADEYEIRNEEVYCGRCCAKRRLKLETT